MSDDLIKRSDAIDAVMNTEPVFAVDSLEPYQKTKDVVEALEAIPSADRPQGEWIPCSERLPSEKDYIGDVVIWCTDKSIVGVGWYYDSTKSWATVDDTFPPILGEVIAWMPLPKPWKGADDEID